MGLVMLLTLDLTGAPEGAPDACVIEVGLGAGESDGVELQEHPEDIFAEPGFGYLPSGDGVDAYAEPLGRH